MELSSQNSNPVPTRKSVSSYALIRPADCPPDQLILLLQWNMKWKKMNLISGHQEPEDPNEAVCIIREIHEELFTPLNTSDLEKMRNTLRGKDDYDRNRDRHGWYDPQIRSVRQNSEKIQYIEFSQSAKEWTQYEMTVFDAELEQTDGIPEFSERGNEWVTEKEILEGLTKSGNPVSPTVKRILKECGRIEDSRQVYFENPIT